MRLRLLVPALLFVTAMPPAFAVNKDMVQLQTQVQQLQDAVARLQQSNDERMGVLKDLVQQSADSVNRMSVNMDALQKQLAAQQTATGAKVDQVSGQVSALSDSVDELKARIGRLEKALAAIQGQQDSIAAALQNLPAPGTSPGTSLASPAATAPAAAATNPASTTPAATETAPPTRTKPGAATPLKAQAPPVEDLYRAAYNDYMAAKYSVAISEFNDVIKAYPENNLSGNAWYYLGEIDYRAAKYAAAAKDYDKVLEQYPDNNKIPAAHLHKGQALLALKQNDAAIRELRSLIQRFPTAPEATQARSRLSGMGVPVKPKA